MAEALPPGGSVLQFPQRRRQLRGIAGQNEQTVTGRDFFRLPLVQGRDLEVELDVVSETFRVSVAQSPTELASD